MIHYSSGLTESLCGRGIGNLDISQLAYFRSQNFVRVISVAAFDMLLKIALFSQTFQSHF